MTVNTRPASVVPVEPARRWPNYTEWPNPGEKSESSIPDSETPPEDDSDGVAVAASSGKRGRAATIASWTMIGIGAVILVGTAWLGWRSYQASAI